jgi:coenzyme F420 hydrogenase subunit beta
VAPTTTDPLYWGAHVSEQTDEIMTGSGSRYGPAAALTPLMQLLEDQRSMAVIAKPCDVAAVRNLISERPHVKDTIAYLLVLACGGASRMTKNWALLDEFGVTRDNIAEFRHRGLGNPGPTRVVTRDERVYDTTYLALWEDEGTWDLQWRCKVCPDGMGEVADLVSMDCWPGGAPTGEDEGFNGIIARTERGAELLAAAIADGVIDLTHDGLPVDETLEDWQPHQSRRKAAVPSRLRAMESEGLPVLRTTGLRLDRAEARMSAEEQDQEFSGSVERIRRGDQT